MVEGIIGIVNGGKFYPLNEPGQQNHQQKHLILTDTKLEDASGINPINLDDYEDKVIQILGYRRGNTIYNARINDIGGPIIKDIALKVFQQSTDNP